VGTFFAERLRAALKRSTRGEKRSRWGVGGENSSFTSQTTKKRAGGAGGLSTGPRWGEVVNRKGRSCSHGKWIGERAGEVKRTEPVCISITIKGRSNKDLFWLLKHRQNNARRVFSPNSLEGC